MADETILIDIEFESNAAQEEQQIDDLTASIEGLKVAQSQLDEEVKRGSKTQVEASKQKAKISTQLQTENKQRKDLIKIVQSETGSRDKMRLGINKLIKERDGLNTTTAKGAKRSEELRKKIDKLTATQKNNGVQVQKQKANIGNYGDALGGLQGPLGRAGQATKMFGAQLKILLANPIVAFIALIVGAFAGLRAALKRSEEGQNALNKISAVVGSTLNVLADIVTKVAEFLVRAFEDPQQAVKDLWEVIKTNLINRIEGLANLFIGLKDVGVNSFRLIGASIKNVFTENQAEVDKLKEGVKDAASEMGQALIQASTGFDVEQQKAFIQGFKDLGTEISEEAKITKDLADRQAALDKLVRENLVREATLRKEIAEARAVAANKDDIDAKTRLAALDEAIEKENEVLANAEKLAQERLKLQQIQNNLGASTKDDLNAEAQLQVDLINLETINAEKRKRLLSERVTTQREVRAQEKAAIDEDFLSDQELFDFENELEAERITEQNELKLEIQAEQDAAVLEMNADLEKEKTKLTEEGEANRRAAIGASLSAIGQLSGQANALLQQQNQNRLSNDLAALNAKEQTALMRAGDNEAKRAQIEATFQKKREKLEKDAAKKAKKLAITMAIIRGALVILNALNTAPFIPVGVIAAAAAAVVTGFQIAAIKNAKMEKGGQVPLAKKGANFGTFNGPSHASGGIDLFTGSGKHVANVEGNENFYVINKKASDHLNGLSDINQRIGGGVPLNGTATKMARGGQANVETAQPGIDINDITRQVVDRLPPIVVMTEDIKTGLEDRNEVVNVGVI